MAKKFKDYYDVDCAILLAGKIKQEWQAFDSNAFNATIERSVHDKEFLQRQDLFTDAFEQFLPLSYPEIIALFHNILGPELKTAEGMFTHGWWLWPIGRYVERHGTVDFNTSVAFIRELTKRFTGEFAMRPLIEKHPEQAMEVLKQWSTDDNVHVRRLASECMRIRLPWARKSVAALADFESFKKVLANLKSDPEKFVQKSVGNNLNDLMKEDPAKAREIIAEWQKGNPSKETLWIIKHGLRSARKTSLEQILMTLNKQEMMAWLEAQPKSFTEAVHLALTDKQTLSWRAAWLLWSCMEDNDPRIKPFIPKIIECLHQKKDGHQRELLKILYRMDLSEAQEGVVFDLCMNVWEQAGKTPSVRHNAFRMIVRIASKYPELSNEITFITQDHYMETLSPGVRRSVMKMCK